MINWYGKEILKEERKDNTNIYVNIELSKEEVSNIIRNFISSKNLNNLDYTVTTCEDENKSYTIFLRSDDNREYIYLGEHNLSDSSNISYAIFDSGYSTGWTSWAPTTTLLLENVSIIITRVDSDSENTYNNEFTQLLSSVPFVKGEEYNFVEISSSSGSGEDMLQARVDATNSCKYLFYYYEGDNVDYIANLNTSNVTNMYGMFSYCKALTTIPQLNTSNVTDMQYMFQYCNVLTSVPQLNTSKVTDMQRMFNYCRALTSIPQLDTSKVTNMTTMFYNCSNLTTIPLLDTSSCTNMNGMFDGCSKLRTIPQLDTSKVTNMGAMFSGCSALETIPQLDTSNVTNIGYMFYICRALTSVPQLDTSNVTNISKMFQSCNVLTSVPQLNTSKVIDMNSMFYYCTALETIDITYYNISSTSYSQSFVQNCTALKSLIIRGFGSNYVANSNSFTGSGIESGTGYIYVPRNMVDTLKSATNWSTYADQIRALEDYTVDGTTTGALDETKI